VPALAGARRPLRHHVALSKTHAYIQYAEFSPPCHGRLCSYKDTGEHDRSLDFDTQYERSLAGAAVGDVPLVELGSLGVRQPNTGVDKSGQVGRRIGDTESAAGGVQCVDVDGQNDALLRAAVEPRIRAAQVLVGELVDVLPGPLRIG